MSGRIFPVWATREADYISKIQKAGNSLEQITQYPPPTLYDIERQLS